MSEHRGFCRWCVGFLFSLGLTAFFLWLSYLPHRPRYFVTDFQLPPLANGTASPRDPTVNFTLEIENKNKQLDIYYDNLNVTLAYRNKSRSVTIQRFHQGHDKTTDEHETADAWWVPWPAAAGEVAKKGKAVFRVSVASGFRYKGLLWKGKHHWVKVGADVEVDGEGKKILNKGIRLKSSAPPPAGARWGSVVAAPVVVVAAAAVVLAQPLVPL